jgi:hypothetical protein
VPIRGRSTLADGGAKDFRSLVFDLQGQFDVDQPVLGANLGGFRNIGKRRGLFRIICPSVAFEILQRVLAPEQSPDRFLLHMQFKVNGKAFEFFLLLDNNRDPFLRKRQRRNSPIFTRLQKAGA